jgi:hypothetical protein
MDAQSPPSNRLKKPAYSFTCIPNALLRDASVSLKAKGLYGLMFSKPDDWVFHVDALVAESNDGRDGVTISWGYPLYAIRKAAKWTVVGRDRLPSVAASSRM